MTTPWNPTATDQDYLAAAKRNMPVAPAVANPCPQCPFNRSTEPGLLGGSPVETYVGQIYAPFVILSHAYRLREPALAGLTAVQADAAVRRGGCDARESRRGQADARRSPARSRGSRTRLQ